MDPIKTLGTFIALDARRDAIHIAVAPMEAAEALQPGQHVGTDGQGRIHASEPHIGIVDPFLRCPIEAGRRCWLMLYPNSITSLRHEWAHPALQAQEPMDELRIATEAVANQCGKTYEALMDDMRSYNWSLHNTDWGDYIMDNSERYKDVDEEAWKKAWAHFERVTGEKPRDKYLSGPYTCSC